MVAPAGILHADGCGRGDQRNPVKMGGLSDSCSEPKKVRKHYTAEEKVAILRRHLLEQEPVSKLCDDLGLQPTVFYRWQKEFFENGAAAFQTKARSDHQAEQE